MNKYCLECSILFKSSLSSTICDDCDKNHTYDMITDNVAIGSYKTSYDSFDLIINLNYPQNGVKFKEVVYEKENISNKLIIKCGYIDTEKKGGGLSSDSLNDLLNKIDEYQKYIQKEPKILFHCYAGVSRSATVAIAYLAKSQNKTTQEVYELAKQKRSRINPNEGFRKILGLETDKDEKEDKPKFVMWF